MTKNQPPKANELELSLFGPGIGECLVVHLGDGEWMVVDSCLNANRDKPIALEYLESLKVHIETQVKLVVVTHWHDDHIRGVSQVIRSAGSARFACSGALMTEEFCTLVCAHDEIRLVENTSGLSEFADVLESLKSRRGAVGPDHWAADGTRLYATPNVEVYALSPSAQTISDSKGQFASLIPALGNAHRRFNTVTPNSCSVALLVKSTNLHMLLGADLEKGHTDQHGWRAVASSPLRPQLKGSAFKVAHHGSEGADHEDIWARLLAPSVHALLTPYARGRKPLPSKGDVKRIKARTKDAFCTVWPPTLEPPKRRNVDKTMGEVARTRRALRRTPGHLRVRGPFAGSAQDLAVERFDGATRL
jgi:hypothetical protein